MGICRNLERGHDDSRFDQTEVHVLGFFLDQSGILSVMKFSVGQKWMVRKPRQ